MSTSSVIMANNEIRCLDLLRKSIRYMSCGKLKKGSDLINEALRFGLNNSEEILDSIAECKKLGLIIQTRKYLMKADQLLKGKQYNEALERYQTIGCVGIPHDLAFQVLHNKAICMVQVGDLNGSLVCFRQALAIDPMHSLALRNTAYVLMALKMYDNALHFFSDLIRMDEIDSSHLLYVLYGAAECRQVLYPSREGEEAVLRAQQAVEQHQGLQSKTSLPVQKESYSYSKKAIPHTVYDFDPLSACPEASLHIDTEQQQEPAHIATHVPFRRIRYQANNNSLSAPTNCDSIVTSPVSPVPTFVGPVVPILECTIPPDSEKDRSVIGSPLAAKSRDKREMLHRAVMEFDRSALPSGASEWNVVSANEPMLGHRRRDTDPSASQLAVPSPLHVRSWLPAESTHHSISTDVSTPVSSRKPGLGMHSRPMHMRPPTNKPADAISDTAPVEPHEHTTGPIVVDQQIPFLKESSSPASAPTPLFSPAPDPVSTASTPRSTEASHPLPTWAARLDMPVLTESLHSRRPSGGSLDAPEFLAVQRPARPRSAASATGSASTVSIQPEVTTPPVTVNAQVEKNKEARVSVNSWIATTVHVEKEHDLLPMLQLHMNTVKVAPTELPTGIRGTSTVSQKVSAKEPSRSYYPNAASVEEKEHVVYPVLSVGIADAPTGEDHGRRMTTTAMSAPPLSNPADAHPATLSHRHTILDTLVSTPSTPVTVPSTPQTIPTKPPKPVGEGNRGAPSIPAHTARLSHETALEETEMTKDCDDSLIISPTDSSMSGDFAADFGNGISPLPSHRQHLARKGLVELHSNGQQEIDRVFESRRYIDSYTVTHSDVLKLRVSETPHFPPARETKRFYPHSVLKTPGPFPHDVDVRHREYYLTDAEFLKLLHTDKNSWDRLPVWRQRSLKQAVGLF